MQNSSFIQKSHMIADILQFTKAVGRNDHGKIAFGEFPGQDALHGLTHQRIQAVEGLVAEKIFGPGTDSKEHEHLTLHSFGKRSEFPSPVQLKALHEIKEAVLVKMGIEDLVIFCHAFPCGIRKKIGLVGEKADPPFDFRIFVYVFSVHHDAAGIRADHTAHDPKEGAFSRSIGPHQPENALFLDCGDDVVQGVCVGEFLIYTVNFYHRLLHTGSQVQKSYRASTNDFWNF